MFCNVLKMMMEEEKRMQLERWHKHKQKPQKWSKNTNISQYVEDDSGKVEENVAVALA